MMMLGHEPLQAGSGRNRSVSRRWAWLRQAFPLVNDRSPDTRLTQRRRQVAGLWQFVPPDHPTTDGIGLLIAPRARWRGVTSMRLKGRSGDGSLQQKH